MPRKEVAKRVVSVSESHILDLLRRMIMRKVLVALMVVLTFAVTTHVQASDTKDQPSPGMTGGGRQMPMRGGGMMGEGMGQMMMQRMEMCRNMMSGQGMMMQEMMHMMKDMMRIQERTMMGAPEPERKRMAQELSLMMERMNKMMTNMQGMMMGGMMGMPAPETQPPPAEGEKEPPKGTDQHKH